MQVHEQLRVQGLFIQGCPSVSCLHKTAYEVPDGVCEGRSTVVLLTSRRDCRLPLCCGPAARVAGSGF
jgi:hypothetical protein